MRFSSTTVPALLLLFAAGVAMAMAAGTTVYRSEGPDGIVRFSDMPPAEASEAEVLRISAPPAVDPAAAQQQLKAMRYSTDRMAESRRERELEREVARLRAQVDALPARQPEREVIRYAPVYLPVPVVPWRPGHRPRPPHHPDLRPLPQPPGILPGYNSQLMRPIVSGR